MLLTSRGPQPVILPPSCNHETYKRWRGSFEFYFVPCTSQRHSNNVWIIPNDFLKNQRWRGWKGVLPQRWGLQLVRNENDIKESPWFPRLATHKISFFAVSSYTLKSINYFNMNIDILGIHWTPTHTNISHAINVYLEIQLD